MHISPDDIGAAVTGAVIVLGAITVGIGKTVALLRDLKAQMDTAQHELTHDHGSSMKDSSVRTEEKVDSLGAALHAVETGLGGIRDELRQIRSESGQTRSEVTEVRISVTELDRKHDALKDAADRTHRDLADGQKDLASQLDELTNPCTNSQEDS